MFWKFHTWSELLASKLQAKTYFQELLSGAAQIINICLYLWNTRKLISLLVPFTAHYLARQKATEKAFLNFFSVLFDLSLKDTDLAGSAAVGRFSTNFCVFLAVLSALELPVQRASKSCKKHESEGAAPLCLGCQQGLILLFVQTIGCTVSVLFWYNMLFFLIKYVVILM